jgi:cyclopropane fatty-acyl-phospholipid synthase-like methyltransferase
MSENLPFSQACENNKTHILKVLEKHLTSSASIVEIGGGTGQHALFFANNLPHLSWQATDLAENIEPLNKRILTAENLSLPVALELDVTQENWPCVNPSHFFTANSLHIMSESSVRKLFAGVGKYLSPGGLLFVYGPFRYQGEFTSKSNAQFDLWLKVRDPARGIRDFETVNELARAEGLILKEDNSMPANNQLIVWEKLS